MSERCASLVCLIYNTRSLPARLVLRCPVTSHLFVFSIRRRRSLGCGFLRFPHLGRHALGLSRERSGSSVSAFTPRHVDSHLYTPHLARFASRLRRRERRRSTLLYRGVVIVHSRRGRRAATHASAPRSACAKTFSANCLAIQCKPWTRARGEHADAGTDERRRDRRTRAQRRK